MDNTERLLIDIKESLERQMRDGFDEMRTRFDNQAARLDRQGALQQSGSCWSAGINARAEKVDSALEVKDREIAELRERLKKLEERPGEAA